MIPYLLRPSKYVATMTYGNWPNCTFGFFVHHFLLLLQLNWPTAKSGTSTLDGFCMTGLFSLLCVILDQGNLHNFTRKV